MNIGELIATLGVDSRQLDTAYRDMQKFERNVDTSVKKINRSLETIGKRMQKIGKDMTRYLTLPITVAGGFAFKMASDMEEAINKVDVAFGKDSEQVKQWSATTLESIGLARNSALDMVALFGDMSTSMGFTTDAAAAMSMNLVRLAGDLASFKNIRIDIAQTALSGVFTGETESLKRLGIVMTEVNLQEFAMSKGITKRIRDMSQAEKVQLRYNYILNVTKNSQGDFARTSESAANQMRIFRESLKELGIVFGQVLLPVLTPMIKRTNDWLQRISKLSTVQKKWILRIAGITAAMGPLLKIMGFLSRNVFPLLVTVGTAVIKMFNQMRVVMMTNPYTALAGAIGILIVGLITLAKRTNDVTAAQKALNDVNRTALSNIAEQKTKIEQLFRIAKSENASLNQRKAAIQELNKLVPQLNNSLNIEKINTEAVTTAKQAYIQELLREAKVRAAQEKLIELEKRALNELVEADASRLSLGQQLMALALGGAKATGKGYDYMAKKSIQNFNTTKSEIESTREALQTFIDSLLTVQDIAGKAGGKPVLDITGGEGFTKIKQQLSDDAWAKALKQSATDVREGLNEALNDGYFYESVKGNLNDVAEGFRKTGEIIRVAMDNTPIQNLKQALRGVIDTFVELGVQSNSVLDFARSVVAAGKKIVATYLAESVATAVKSGLKSAPFPFNLVAAGIAGGAAAALFNSLVPSFAKGGIATQPTLAMVGDNPARKEAIVPLERAGDFGFGGGRKQTKRTLVHEISGRNLRIILEEEDDYLSLVT